MDEIQAIQQLKQGNPAGLEALVKKYQVQAVRAAFLVVWNHELAEDIVQTAFLRVYERIQQFDPQRPFGPWFFKIVVNETNPSQSAIRMEIPPILTSSFFRKVWGGFPAGKFGQVPADEVEAVLMAGSPGEYVSGGFIYRLESDFSSWLKDPSVGQQLAWQKGDHWFIISANITLGHPGYMDKQGLIALAESLVGAPPMSVQERLRPENLHTLAEAEILAGFDLKAPGNLPDGVWLYQIQFAPRLPQLRLTYVSAAGSWLEILEIPEAKFNLEKLVSRLPTAEKVEIKGNDGWYVNRDVPSSSPVFLEGGAHEALFWREDGIVYRILFFPGSDTGDRIGRTGMVAIGSI